VQRGEWWQSGVLYQIYPRSWADSNADGVGDLAGITNHLDHLRRLGVDGIWLNPIHPSPSKDWGYDVSDYLDVHPNLGTLADLDRLVAEAGREDIRVLLDLVPNHTSDLHPWFIDSRSSRQARHRDWYVWADPRPGGLPPNNWVSSFGGPAWTLDPITGQYYLHNFLPEQPDLNWWSDEVRDEFDQILRFWFDRKIAGFRIDVTHGIIHDRELRDNPPALSTDHPVIRRRRMSCTSGRLTL
jgi:alpha-glucosidase